MSTIFQSSASMLYKRTAAAGVARHTHFIRLSSTLSSSTSTSSSSSFASTSAPPTSTASTSTSNSSSRPEFFKVTLMRSCIGLRPEVRKTVSSLGFKKRMQTIYQPVDQGSVGKLLRIKELVKVETVSRETMLQETAPKDRSEKRGYSVVGKAFS